MVLRKIIARARLVALDIGDMLLAGVVGVLVFLVRLMPERAAADLAGRVTTFVGMRLPRSKRVGLANLALAFPDKSPEEHRRILEACWDNLGRLAVEYCHLDRIWDFVPDSNLPSRVEFGPDTVARFLALRDAERPSIIVSAHLANWELPMLAAAAHGVNAAALYRAPNNRWIARWVLGQRKVAMGELIPSRRGSVHRLSETLEQGKHLGLLTDQYFYSGVKLPFFGHDTLTNQLFARLARLHDCTVHAVRVIRLPGDRFRFELTEALPLPRDAAGRIDPKGAAIEMNKVFEAWIREYPGQWLWLHRKWRGD